MGIVELLVLSVGLSMDAMAAAVCKGLSVRRLRGSHALITGLYFGGFQALMPMLGYMGGMCFRRSIERFDHWVAFVLLSVIGIHMIRESFGEAERTTESFSPRAMLPMAIATSIDALAVGVTFACLGMRILPAVSVIGMMTFLLSSAGVWIGQLFGARFKGRAERIGGAILILMGLKLLSEHLGFWPGAFG